MVSRTCAYREPAEPLLHASHSGMIHYTLSLVVNKVFFVSLLTTDIDISMKNVVQSAMKLGVTSLIPCTSTD